MPNVDAFLDAAARDLRGGLAYVDKNARRALEDAIALMTDYRLSGMDEAAFNRLLAMLRAGRSPVGLAVLAPQTIARDLAARWEAYAAQHEARERVPALT